MFNFYSLSFYFILFVLLLLLLLQRCNSNITKFIFRWCAQTIATDPDNNSLFPFFLIYFYHFSAFRYPMLKHRATFRIECNQSKTCLFIFPKKSNQCKCSSLFDMLMYSYHCLFKMVSELAFLS